MELYSQLKVLLVEDDEVANYITEIALKRCGIKDVHVSFNGLDALDVLENEKIEPDIILLDLNMPMIGGLEFLQKSYEMEIGQKARIFILTSSIRPEDKTKASEFENVEGYLEKPLNEKKIKNMLSNF